MKKPGQVALVPFPHVDLTPGKPRPVLLPARGPGPYDDSLFCMLSTQIHQQTEGFDEVIGPDAGDYEQSGLKAPTVIRLARLAVVSDGMLLRCIGAIGKQRLVRIRERLAAWIQGAE